MTNEWRDYTGGPIPAGTTHVQTLANEVIDLTTFNLTGPRILRYFGPEAAPAAVPADEVIPPIYPQDYETVVQLCAAALLRGARVAITHPAGYSRCDLDIPDEKGPELTHEYSPIKLLKWIGAQIPKAY